jgi:hypothetical protein
MGKRSRKRGDGATRRPEPTTTTTASAPRAVGRKARLEELPPAPWAPFPLVELCILLGLILMGIGLFAGGDRRGVFLLCGVALASLAGLEQAIREHAAGFRSHTTLLAGVVGVLVLIVGTAVGVPREIALVLGVAAFAGAWFPLRRVFQHRSGGLGFRA